MKAMLLAAGYGKRMLPLTRILPKPAIPVLGRPLASQVIHRLALQGVREAVINLHHLPEVIRDLLQDGSDVGLERLRYSFEERILGTAGGILEAAPHLLGEGAILVRNLDFVADISLDEVRDAHRASGLPVTLVLAAHRPGYSVVEVDDAGRVLSLGGRPEVDPARVAGRYLFTGCHVLEPEVLGRIPPDRPSDIVRDVYRPMAAEGKVGAYVHRGFWWEFGTPRDYLDGSLRLMDLDIGARARIVESDPVHEIGDAHVAVGPGADFHDGVDLHGRVALGMASMVAEGSRVSDSVIMPEAWVGPGCELRRAILARGVELPAGFQAEDVLICPDTDPEAELPPHTRRQGKFLVRSIALVPERT